MTLFFKVILLFRRKNKEELITVTLCYRMIQLIKSVSSEILNMATSFSKASLTKFIFEKEKSPSSERLVSCGGKRHQKKRLSAPSLTLVVMTLN